MALSCLEEQIVAEGCLEEISRAKVIDGLVNIPFIEAFGDFELNFGCQYIQRLLEIHFIDWFQFEVGFRAIVYPEIEEPSS